MLAHIVYTGLDNGGSGNPFGNAFYEPDEQDLPGVDNPAGNEYVLANKVTVLALTDSRVPATSNNTALVIGGDDGSQTGTDYTFVFGISTGTNNPGILQENTSGAYTWNQDITTPAEYQKLQGIYVMDEGTTNGHVPAMRTTSLINEGPIFNNSIIELGDPNN